VHDETSTKRTGAPRQSYTYPPCAHTYWDATGIKHFQAQKKFTIIFVSYFISQQQILTLTLPQAEAMWAKFEARLLRDFHGVAGLPSEQACWVLPKVQASPAAKYVRRHEGVKERRGPYQKVGYSHTSGGYAQTTYTQSDHRALGLPKDSATSMAPLRSAHTRRHACSERHFRLSVVVVVSSFA
jgi:hypothetical protein